MGSTKSQPKSQPSPEPEVVCEVCVKEMAKEAIVKWGVSRMAHWGPPPLHAAEVAVFMIGQRWRADNYKNYWHYVGSGLAQCDLGVKQNWRTVSYETVCDFYESYTQHIDGLKDYLVTQREDETEVWEKIHRGKKRRIDNVLDSTPITLPKFIQILKKNHKDLPPLRGLRRKVVTI